MAYEEEYYGLNNNTKSWTYISEEEYQHIKQAVGNALPKISLTIIKTDANGKPQLAKYRIYVLGNFEPTNWSRKEVFATVLYQI